MKNLNLLFSAFLYLLCGTALGQSSAQLHHVLAGVSRFHERYAPEKVYLHTDKSFYFMGDTLWFKAYVFDALNVSAAAKSQRLYVELNDDSLTNVKRIAIPIAYGIGWGQIPLSAKQIREGNYTLRAYTNWMQNLQDGRFFKQRIYIGRASEETWHISSTGSVVKDEKGEEKLNIQLQIADLKQQPIAGRQIQVSIRNAERSLARVNELTSSTGTIDVLVDLKEKWRSRDLQLSLTDLENKNRQIPVNVPLLFNRPQAIDLQFFPEGGKLVTGISGLVAFKALNEDGRGVQISGAVYDSKNNQVAQFSSLDKGMGVFTIRPSPGENYTARIQSPQGNNIIYKLPDIQNDGTVLNIVNKESMDSLIVKPKFSSNAATLDSYFLIGESRGFVCYAAVVHPEDSLIKVSKNIFPSGIAHFTLLKDTIALNERLVFIKHDDQLKVNIAPASTPQPTEDSITLDIDVKDSNGNPVKGAALSMAVTNDSLVHADTAGNNSIISWLLLRSDLRGYIEEPSWYFSQKNPNRWQGLDNLLLTQGWVGLDWSRVFNPAPPRFNAEQGLEVTGRVISAFKKPVKGARVLLISQKPDFIRDIITNENGQYRFNKLPLLDTPFLFVMAHKANGKNLNTGELILDKFSPPNIQEEFLPRPLPWYATQDTTIKKGASIVILNDSKDQPKLNGKILKEVVIKGKKIIPNSNNPNGSGNADIVLNATDIKATGAISLYDLLRTTLPGFKVIMKDGYPTVMMDNYYLLLLRDGRGLPMYDIQGPVPDLQSVIEALKNQMVSSYTGVEIMYSRKYTRERPAPVAQKKPSELFQEMANAAASGRRVVGYDEDKSNYEYTSWRYFEAQKHDWPGCFIEITTKNKTGYYENGNSRPDHVLYRPVGVTYPKQFYNPKYQIDKDGAAPLPQPTIFWKPDIVTDNEGKARVSFHPYPKPWSYSVIVQGADLMGNVGSAVERLQ